MDEKKITLRLNNRKHTGLGIVSFVLGITTLVLFVTVVMISAFATRNYNIGIGIGIIEIIGFIVCIVGIIYGIMAEMTQDTIKTFAHIGMGINLVVMIFHILVIVYGFGG